MVKFKRFAELTEVADELLKYVIVVARYKGKFIFCRHKKRDTWEIAGGKREQSETIIETAHRELFEETGAKRAIIRPVCIFVVAKEQESYGCVFYADVQEMGAMPECEMSEIGLFDKAPKEQTYSDVHPKVFKKVLEFLKHDTDNNYNDSETYTKDYFKILSPKFPQWLTDYINTPAMQRIDKIMMSCGCDYSTLYNLKFSMSNLKHSIGVALIVWNFTKDKKATLSGLFHDIATPCFKHCVDFLRGDSETQESTEDLTEQIIRDSKEIMALLKRDGITVDEIKDYKIYPIADNDTPQLSADRLEYTLSNGIFFDQVWSMEKLKEYYNDLVVTTNEHGIDELAFKTKELAIDFVVRARKLWELWFESRDKLLMQFIADTLKEMQKLDLIKESDLYNHSDQEILDMIKNCGNERIVTAFHKFQHATECHESDTKPSGVYARKIKTKKRYINPLILTKQGAKRITELSDKAKAAIDEWKSFECPAWASFDFDLLTSISHPKI